MKDLEIKQELREDVDCIVRDYLEKVLASDKKAVKSFVHLMFLSYAKARNDALEMVCCMRHGVGLWLKGLSYTSLNWKHRKS